MSKQITNLAIAGALVAVAYFGGTTLAVIALIATLLILLKVVKLDSKPSGALMLIAAIGVVITGGLIPAEYGSSTSATISTPTVITNGVVSQPGQEGTAVLKLNVKDQLGATYAGTGTVYALKSGIVTDRNDLMQKIYDGNTASITPNTMTLTSGVEQFNGFSGKIGDQVVFAGYKDSTPGAAENVSFVKTVTITGITAGSTPEWMLSDAQFVWYNYPTLLFYNQGTARTIYEDDEDTAIEKSITFDVYPTNNGEQYIDTALWLESPEANIAAIKKVEVVAPDGSKVSYGMPQEVTSTENKFRAKPALTTSTNKMYYVGALPVDAVRTSTTEKGKYSITVTYDHPASSYVNMYFKITSNTNALTSTGGHIDTPSTNLNLNMSSAGTDGWT